MLFQGAEKIPPQNVDNNNETTQPFSHLSLVSFGCQQPAFCLGQWAGSQIFGRPWFCLFCLGGVENGHDKIELSKVYFCGKQKSRGCIVNRWLFRVFTRGF